MGKSVATIASYFAFILFLLPVKAASTRHLYYDAAELVSDALTDGTVRRQESVLFLKGTDASEEQCRQMYGFLPCSTNIPGHIFLIVIYEYLLYHGEAYAGGDGRIFHVFGNNFVVSSFSQLLDSLPESLILLVSGLLSSNEETQEYVITGVGLLAGSSIFLLTVLWGICLLCASHKFYVKPGSNESKNWLQILTGSGIDTDSETSDHAKIMLFSVIPFIIILIPIAFDVSYSSQEYNYVVLASLVIAVFCLCYYFYYQYKNKKIHDRILEYAELERKIEMHVPYYEVQALMRKRDKHLMEKQIEMEKSLQDPNVMITRDDFLCSFSKWIESTRHSMDDPYSDKSKTKLNQVAQLLFEDKLKFMKLIYESLMGEKQDQSLMGEKQDESLMVDIQDESLMVDIQDESSINKFFESIDDNKDSLLTPIELKKFIISKHGDGHIYDIVDELVEIIMDRVDSDANGQIDKEEFKSRAIRWLRVIEPYMKLIHTENKKKVQYQKAEAKSRKDGTFKAIALLVLGILMLTVLVEPLTQTVRIFSESMRITPFYVSFILVPLATNARTAIAAIRAAGQKRYHTTSLTFSEIYHKVFMNNILGFSVLVAVIYFRGLMWHFSAEVLVLVIVCVIMGLLASFRSKFPNWILFFVFPLYPLSLVLVYYVDDTFK